MKIENDILTFEWRGTSAPKLVGDFNNWDEKHAIHLARTAKNFWTHNMTLPRDTYMEYAFIQRGRRLRDRLNPTPLSPNGVGAFNNYVYMPEAKPTDLIKRDRNIPHGKVTHHRISAPRLITTPHRTIHLYHPPTSKPCPLIVVYDGQDYLERGYLTNIVDNLIAQRRIRPVALAMIDNGGLQNRFIEYACSDATLNLLTSVALPLAHKHLNLVKTQGAYAVLGASMGGLMAIYTALRLPKIFGKAISESGAFPFESPSSVITDFARYAPHQDIKVWMNVGHFDFPYIQQTNPLMRDLLVAKGYDVTYREYNGGHNYPAWRNEVWRGLETMFAPAKNNL